MYLFQIYEKIEDSKKVKNITKSVVNNSISFSDFLDCLFNFNVHKREQYMIRSRLHKVQTVQQTKIALSPYDDKRFLIKDSTATLP